MEIPEVTITWQLTQEMLQGVCPNASKNISVFVTFLNKYMPKYGITDIDSIRAFIANVAEESGEFHYVEEIASGKAYEGRKDLGNTQPGDGVKFKGHGLIQTTGRANHDRVGKALGLDLINHPELLTLPEYAVMSACFFWQDKGLNDVARLKQPHVWRGDTYSWFEWCCIKVNGGLTHIENRKAYMKRAEIFIK